MTHIQQRREDAATWTSVNPVLYEGEAGHELDTGKWKLGDGVTAWVDLDYKAGVDSVAGKTGIVTLDIDDVDGAAPLASPAFTGTPSAPTPLLSSDSTRLATTEFVKEVLLAAHPVGDIKYTTNSANPSTYIGGTWEAYGEGLVLVGVDAGQTEFDTVGETGGVKEVTLTAAQSGLPAHDHDVTDPGHQHANPGAEASPFFSEIGPSYGVTIPSTEVTSVAATGLTVDAVAAAPAAEAHTNLQPYGVVYIWRRTA